MKPALAVFVWLVSFLAVSAKTPPSEPKPEEEAIALSPIKIQAQPTTSFALELDVRVTKNTRKVGSIVIVRVEPGSDASAAGLQPGDEIIKINGQPVAGMDGRVTLEADLAKLLINRPLGEKIHLEVVTKRTRSVTLRSAAGQN